MTRTEDEIGIRMLSEKDRDEVARLAERDSAPAPTGRVLGASLDGRLVAAISLSTRVIVADPFIRTAELQTLLRRRAAQLDGSHRGSGPSLGILSRRSRAALPSSPPGGGGRLLKIWAGGL